VIIRTWQTAHKMKMQRGKLEATPAAHDTSGSSATSQIHDQSGDHAGISHIVGSVEPGKLADLVLWKPAFSASSLR
jgi:urease subunit alpha